jgi:hypothetical protein
MRSDSERVDYYLCHPPSVTVEFLPTTFSTVMTLERLFCTGDFFEPRCNFLVHDPIEVSRGVYDFFTELESDFENGTERRGFYE